ncbi:carboxypeptidase M32 [Simkania sp.]|uniref:carboxypeptidase M32 n=1 Tax=Simkania sp. TaxID=34094 RepID=UPI003B52B9E4
MTVKEKYDRLHKIGKEIRLLVSFGYFLEWDQETFMPKGAIEFRSEQIELISSITHREKTSERFKEALEALIDLDTGKPHDDDLDEEQKANLREWHREYLHETKLPNDFVKAFAKTSSKATNAWAQAKNNDTFETFAPHLHELIELCRKKADYIGYEDHPYDAFLSIYEPGVTTQTLKDLFGALKPFLSDLLKAVSQKQTVDDRFLHGSFSQESQLEFDKYLLEVMHLDPKHSRLDLSEHPFCLGLHPHDVRLTTHTVCSNFMHSISAVMHEGGHAIYELQLPVQQYGAPLGEFASYGMHESQSRWWETIIGLSRPFWEFAYPKLQSTFPTSLEKVNLETFYQAINRCRPSCIRIFADEISYILHIILRFEIELAFLEGKLEVADLPQAWNDKMQESLGITPQDDKEGCLQDIHWSAGLFGYFPTYALGNLYAAQLYQIFTQTFPDHQDRMRQGNFTFIKDFLKEKIHRFGKQYPPLELLERATGSPLSPEPYMNYLKNKFQ